MTRKSRTQRQRAAARRASSNGAAQDSQSTSTSVAATSSRREKRAFDDSLALYRSIAAPSMAMRWVLVAGLLFNIVADLISIYDSKAIDTAGSLALVGMFGILLFLGGGFVRHQRAIFRIRREHPGAWPTSMRFAMSTLPIPLGFGGSPTGAGERNIRRLTILLVLVFAVAALINGSHR